MIVFSSFYMTLLHKITVLFYSYQSLSIFPHKYILYANMVLLAVEKATRTTLRSACVFFFNLIQLMGSKPIHFLVFSNFFFGCWQTLVRDVWYCDWSFRIVVLGFFSNNAFNASCWLFYSDFPFGLVSSLLSPERDVWNHFWKVV